MARMDALRGLTGAQFRRMQTRLKNQGFKHLRELADRLYVERGGCCEKCGRQMERADLHPHHRHYRNQWDELPEDIVLMCNDCHRPLHERHRLGALTREDAPFIDPLWVDENGDIIAGRKSPRTF
jgi:hypothetical protein